MSLSALIILALLFFVTSVIGVVTGSNSLITVPVMFQFGIDEKEAVATNMFGLTFMAVGGTIPFLRRGMIDRRKVSPLVLLTLAGSALGAALVGMITNEALKLIVSVAMILIAVFTLVRPHQADADAPARQPRLVLVYVLTFFLAIYGGLYSGGYVTVLTAMLVAFFAMRFSEAVGATKLINVFSSLVASVVFIWQGLVNFRLGIMLGAVMFAGAYVGAHYASRMNETWLRRVFLSTVFLLAVKTLYDLTGPSLSR
jgi:uncharacterized protein